MKNRCTCIVSLLLVISVFFFSCGTDSRQSLSIRIMTYNLHHCEGEDGVYDVERIAAFMQETGADIILCQEVDRGYSERSRFDLQPVMLKLILGYNAFYGPNIDETYGNLILSRFPIERAENVPLPNPENKEPRGVIVSTITVDGVPFSVLNTHLSAFSAVNREEQIAFLNDLIGKQEHPVFFGADFNTRPSQQLKPLLDGGVLVSTRHGILGLGEGIDDILVTADIKDYITAGKVVENVYSDHPAYRMDLTIERTEK